MEEPTLRDLFALFAMQALMHPQRMREKEDILSVPSVAYALADRMLEERKK